MPLARFVRRMQGTFDPSLALKVLRRYREAIPSLAPDPHRESGANAVTRAESPLEPSAKALRLFVVGRRLGTGNERPRRSARVLMVVLSVVHRRPDPVEGGRALCPS